MSTDPTRTDPGHLGDGAAPEAGADAVVPSSGSAQPEADPAGGRRQRGALWWVGTVLATIVGAVVLIVLGLVLYLQTGSGRDTARGLVVGQIANLLADDAEVSAEGVGGTFLADAALTGLEVRRDGELVLALDTVVVEYTLATLLRRTFSASDLTISGLRAVVRQRADSTFNVQGLLKPADEDEQKAGFAVLLDQATLRRGEVDVRWYRADGRDSVHAIRDLSLVVRDFRQDGESLSGTIDGLGARLLAPFGRGEAELSAAGAFTSASVALRQLTLVSEAGTQIDGEAQLILGEEGTLPVFDASLAAAPLALSDARAFVGTELYGDPRLRLRADSDGELLTFTLTGALDDATVNLDGELSRTLDGPTRYRAEGSLRRLDLSALTRNPALASEITGDLRLNLQGTTPEAISGPVRVALRESRIGGRTVDRLLVDGSFAAGRVTFDVDGALPGASLTAEGLARPFDEVPTFQVAGTAQDVDLGVLLPGSGRSDAFAGEFALIGRGRSVDAFEGEIALDLTRAEIGLPTHRIRFSDLQLDADVTRGFAAFDAIATLADGGGSVDAIGTLELGDAIQYAVTDGRATNLNLTALTGNPGQDSDLSGDFTLRGDVAQGTLDLTTDLRESRYGVYDVASGQLAAGLRDGTVTLDAALDLGAGGQLTAEGTAQPFATPLAFDLRGTVQNLDLGSIQDDPALVSDLTGAYTATGAGLAPAEMTLDATVQITEPSSYGNRFIDDADLAIALDGGTLTVGGTATTPEGAFDLALTGRPFDASGPSFAFDGTCFRDLDASEFAVTAPRTSLTGCFSGSIAGLPDLSTASASGTVTLQPSRIGDAEVEDGRVVFALQDGALDGSLEAQLASPFPDPGVAEGGRLDATFGGRPFDEVPSYDLQGTTDRLDVALLLDLPPEQPLRLTTAFDVAGRGTDPETMTLGGSVASRSSVVGPVALDTLRAQFGLASGVLRVDTLLVDSDLIDARGGGVLALFDVQAASDFGIEGEVESLAPLVAEGDGTLGLEQGTFVLRAESDPGAPLRIIGTSEARQFVYSQTAETLSGQTETVTYAVTGLNTALDASWDRAAADSLGLDAFDGEVRASFDQFSQRPEGGKPIQVRQGNARLRTDRGDLLVDGSVLVDDRRDLDLSARVDLETNGIELERGRFRIDDATWNLLQPAEITVDNGLIGIRGFLASTDRGTERVAVDGRIDFLGDQDLIVTVENLAIGGLTDFVNLEALGGDLSATLVLSGPAEAPLIDGTVVLDDLTSNGRRVGSLDADVTYADGSLRLDATLTHVDGEMLTVDGTVPLAFTLADGPAGGATSDASAEVSLVARADAFPIAWARPFLDDRAYNALGGTLRLDLRIEGTQAAPRLDGVATITDGRLGVVATGRTYEPILADLTFQNDRIVLDDVRILGRSGRTALDVDGEVRLRELSVGEFDLTITPNNFVAMDTRTYDGLVLDGARAPLRLTGTLDRPVLRGSVVLAEGDIYLTDELVPPELEAVTLTPEQIREVEARFGRVITARDTAVSQFVDALDYDLTVEIRRNVWLRSNQGLAFDVEFEGDVDARKRPFAESSRLFGRVDLVRGSVETLNRQFEVQRGTITFNGDPLAALVDLAAELEIRLPGSLAGQSSATITLGVDGRFNEDLAIRFSANPALEQADIVSLIATGRLADEAVSAGAAGGLALGAASGAFSNIVEGFASRNFGLELAQIDYEGGDLIVRVGDYVSNRLFWTAGFVTPIGDNTREQERLPILLTLDYQLLQWLSAQTEYSGRRGIGSGLNYEIAW